jgi:hypothetical protein
VTTDQPPAPTVALPRSPGAPRRLANRRGVSQEGSRKDLVSCARPHTARKTPDSQVATHNQAHQIRHKIR